MCETPSLLPVAPYPDEFAERYRKAGMWVDETIPEFLENSCTDFAENLAVVAVSHQKMSQGESDLVARLTYAELREQALLAAARVRDAGVRPGDRVLLQLPNIAEYLVYLLGIFWAGGIPVFCLPAHRASDLIHFAIKSDASAHVFSSRTTGADFQQLHRSVASAVQDQQCRSLAGIDASLPYDTKKSESFTPAQPVINTDRTRKSEQVAFLQLSGGTTGLSKLIPRTHADYLYSVRQSVKICQLNQESTLLVVLPASHNFAMSSAGILGAIYTGSTIVFASDPSPKTAFTLIEQEKVRVVQLVPPLAQAWLASAPKRQPNLETLELIQIGGAKLLPSVAEQITPVLHGKLQQVFGMAEGLVNYTRADDSDEMRLHTQGRPMSEIDEIRVVDDNDVPVAEGESGHLLTRGPYTIRGYYNEPHTNVKSFTEDGFYRTGDIVRLHPTGDIEVTGRAKDQINRNGEKIAVDEIEDVALTHPHVYDAVAVGLPDEAVGERIYLVVVPQPDADFGESPVSAMREYFAERQVTPYKFPELVEVMDALPLTNVGKISRRDVRAAVLDHVLQNKENHA